MEANEKDNVVKLPNMVGEPKTMFVAKNEVNEDGTIGAGNVDGPGILINFKNQFKPEPVTEEQLKAAENEDPGTTPEIVLAAVEARLIFTQRTAAARREVALAITKVQEAIMWLQHVSLMETKVENKAEAPKG